MYKEIIQGVQGEIRTQSLFILLLILLKLLYTLQRSEFEYDLIKKFQNVGKVELSLHLLHPFLNQ